MAGIEDLEPSISRKMQFGAAQETYLLGDLYRLTKAGLDPNKTIEDIEQERLEKLYEKFPEFRSGEYENDAAVWTGRVGIMASDPIYYAIPFSAATKLTKLGPRLAALSGLGAATGATSGAIQGTARTGEFSLGEVAKNAGIGAAAGPIFYGVGQGLSKVGKTATKLKDPAYRDLVTPNIFKTDAPRPVTSVGAKAVSIDPADIKKVSKDDYFLLESKATKQVKLSPGSNQLVDRNNYMIQSERVGDAMQINAVKILPEYQNQGLGKELYKEAIDDAFKKNLNLVSDNSVSESALRVYKSLENEGFNVIYNKDVFKRGSQILSKDRKQPVVTIKKPVTSVKKPAHGATEASIKASVSSRMKIAQEKANKTKLPVSFGSDRSLIFPQGKVGQKVKSRFKKDLSRAYAGSRGTFEGKGTRDYLLKNLAADYKLSPMHIFENVRAFKIKENLMGKPKYEFKKATNTSGRVERYRKKIKDIEGGDTFAIKTAGTRAMHRHHADSKRFNANTSTLTFIDARTNQKVKRFEKMLDDLYDQRETIVREYVTTGKKPKDFIKILNKINNKGKKIINQPGAKGYLNFKVFKNIKTFTKDGKVDFEDYGKDLLQKTIASYTNIKNIDVKNLTKAEKKLIYEKLYEIKTKTGFMKKGGRVGYQEGNTVKKEFKDFTEDEKEEFLKKYEEWLKDQNKKMEAAANRQREAMAFDGFLNFMERNKRGIPPVDERTGLYGFANPDVLDVNLKKQIADDIYLQGGAQFLPNGDPYYSAGITKTFNKGGRVGYKEGGSVKPKINLTNYIEHYSDGGTVIKYRTLMKDLAQQVS